MILPELFFLYFSILLFLLLMENRIIFLPSVPFREITETPSSRSMEYEEVSLTCADGVRISGWFIPASPPERAVLLFFHGNAGNNSLRLDALKLFNEHGYTTFIIDYHGYGSSEGSPSEYATYLDAEAAYLYLTETKKIDPSRIVAYGHSLGGAVAIYLAWKHELGALVVEGTFCSTKSLAREIFFYRLFYPFIPERYPSLERVKTIRIPKLFIHASQDEVIPISQGRKLFQAAAEPKKFFEIKGSHNETFELQEKSYFDMFNSFVDEALNSTVKSEK